MLLILSLSESNTLPPLSKQWKCKQSPREPSSTALNPRPPNLLFVFASTHLSWKSEQSGKSCHWRISFWSKPRLCTKWLAFGFISESSTRTCLIQGMAPQLAKLISDKWAYVVLEEVLQNIDLVLSQLRFGFCLFRLAGALCFYFCQRLGLIQSIQFQLPRVRLQLLDPPTSIIVVVRYISNFQVLLLLYSRMHFNYKLQFTLIVDNGWAG